MSKRRGPALEPERASKVRRIDSADRAINLARRNAFLALQRDILRCQIDLIEKALEKYKELISSPNDIIYETLSILETGIAEVDKIKGAAEILIAGLDLSLTIPDM